MAGTLFLFLMLAWVTVTEWPRNSDMARRARERAKASAVDKHNKHEEAARRFGWRSSDAEQECGR